MLAIYAFTQSAKVFATASMTALASAALGGLIGFLFGLPRTREPGGAQPASDTTTYAANTNLEQVSDWLTKILLGAGLVQLGVLLNNIGDLTRYLGPAFTTSEDAKVGEVVALGTFVYFLVIGFLVGFLWTRLKLQDAFARADVAIIRGLISEESKERASADAEALALVDRQLDPNETPPEAKDLTDAVKAAGDPTRVVLFRSAVEKRRAGRDDPASGQIERTIPVFEALIAADGRRQFHRNYGELAFAHGDKPSPDWEQSLAAIESAIQIRDGSRDRNRYRAYEYARAKAKAALNRAKDEIVADLKVAAANPRMRGYLVADLDDPSTPLGSWAAREGITEQDILGP